MGIKYPHQYINFKLELSYIFKLEKKCIFLLTFTPSGARTKNAQREKNDNLSVKNDTKTETLKNCMNS